MVELKKKAVFPTPDYDSGWVLVPDSQDVVLNHDLGTLDTIVYMEFSVNSDGDAAAFPDNPDRLFWLDKTTTQITVRNPFLMDYYARILMWKL